MVTLCSFYKWNNALEGHTALNSNASLWAPPGSSWTCVFLSPITILPSWSWTVRLRHPALSPFLSWPEIWSNDTDRGQKPHQGLLSLSTSPAHWEWYYLPVKNMKWRWCKMQSLGKNCTKGQAQHLVHRCSFYMCSVPSFLSIIVSLNILDSSNMSFSWAMYFQIRHLNPVLPQPLPQSYLGKTCPTQSIIFLTYKMMKSIWNMFFF